MLSSGWDWYQELRALPDKFVGLSGFGPDYVVQLKN